MRTFFILVEGLKQKPRLVKFKVPEEAFEAELLKERSDFEITGRWYMNKIDVFSCSGHQSISIYCIE